MNVARCQGCTRKLPAAAAICALLLVIPFWLFPLRIYEVSAALRLWRAGVRYERVSGLRTLVRDYCEEGRACRCVALVHGLGDSAVTWERILTARGEMRGSRLYAFNMPGTDGSAPPPTAAGYGIKEQSGALARAMQSRCASWTLAGNSLGGWIAAWTALDWPQGVERLVLIGTAGLRDPSGMSRRSGEALLEASPETMALFMSKAYHRPRKIPPRALAQISERVRGRPTRAILEAIEDEDYLDGHIGKLGVPTSIIWGASDGIVPPSQGELFHRALSGSTLDIVPACGHLPQKECPGAVFKALRR
ncbi:MAG: alpha/beta hydrolase [Elusimicrobiota bacterium]